MFYSRQQIESSLDIAHALTLIEDGFAKYSKGEAVIPPFGSLHFDKPKGDAHIKYGYIQGQDYYVVKVASTFPENKDLSSSQGVMLLFNIATGALQAVLHDEGYLTNVRTAAAGAIAAKYLAPKNVSRIGIVGTGTQAYYQLQLLKQVVNCNQVIVWGRSQEKLQKFMQHPELSCFDLEATNDLSHLTESCNLIVTTTSASAPLFFASSIRPGTHVTAIGADDKGKQELDPALFKRADRVVVDSRAQCFSCGDSFHAIQSGDLDRSEVIELGEIISNPLLGRCSDKEITIADLTGLAVQDVQIATAVYRSLSHSIMSSSNRLKPRCEVQ